MYYVSIPVQLTNNNLIHLFILFNLLIPKIGISSVGDVNPCWKFSYAHSNYSIWQFFWSTCDCVFV